MCLIDQFQIFYNLEYLRLYEYLIISQFPVSPQIIYFRWLCVVHFGFCFQYKLIKDALISVFYTYILFTLWESLHSTLYGTDLLYRETWKHYQLSVVAWLSSCRPRTLSKNLEFDLSGLFLLIYCQSSETGLIFFLSLMLLCLSRSEFQCSPTPAFSLPARDRIAHHLPWS